MSQHAHLLSNFPVSAGTHALASQLLHQASAKTGAGSGRELGELRTGLAAVCMFIAGERLNTTEVTKKSAQVASCLNMRDFNKVYSIVQSVLSPSETTYSSLHTKYGTGRYESVFEPYVGKVEGEVRKSAGAGRAQEGLRVCTVYFWMCCAAELKHIPSTEIFADQHGLAIKKFTQLLTGLNNKLFETRKKILDDAREVVVRRGGVSRPGSPTKSMTASPTKSRPGSPTKSPRKNGAEEEEGEEPMTPRRSSRFMETETPTRLRSGSPVKPLTTYGRGSMTRDSSVAGSSRPGSPTKGLTTYSRPGSPTKPSVTLSPMKPWGKRPTRELPTRDTPKKARVEEDTPKKGDAGADDDAGEGAGGAEGVEEDDRMDVDEVLDTPSRRTRGSASGGTGTVTRTAKALPPHLSPTKAIPPHLSPTKPQTQAKIPALKFPTTPVKGLRGPSTPVRTPGKTPGKGLRVMDLEDDQNDIGVNEDGDQMEVDDDDVEEVESESEEEEEEEMPRRRFRPVYLDHRQWGSVDPRIKKMRMKIEAQAEAINAKGGDKNLNGKRKRKRVA